jgi:hypothetical protein
MATPYFFIEGRGRSAATLQIGTPPTLFVWDATTNRHKHQPVSDAAFDTKARQLFIQQDLTGENIGVKTT